MISRFASYAAFAGACAILTGPAPVASAATSIGNPVAGNLGFGTIVEQNAVLGSTETEGTVAVGGNLAFGPGYNVALHTAGTYTAPGDTRPTALLVGGRIDTAASDPNGVLKVLSQGYVKVGDLTGVQALNKDMNGASVNTEIVPAGQPYNSLPHIEENTSQPVASVGPATMPIDFPALFGTYRQRAAAIADCPENVVLNDAAGNPLPQQSGFPAGTSGYITLTPGRTNVLKLSASDLNNLSELSFRTQPNASTPFVVVVTGEVGNWHTPNTPGISGQQAPYILWDFPDATDITITAGDTVEGTIFAPSATLTDLDASNIEGDIVVKTLLAGPRTSPGHWVNAGEIHNFPFAADLECTIAPPPPTTGPTSAPTTSPTLAPTTSPTSGTTSSPGPAPSSPTGTPSTGAHPSGAYSGAPSGPKPSASQLAATGGRLDSLAWLTGVSAVLVAGGAAMLRLRRRQPRGRHMA